MLERLKRFFHRRSKGRKQRDGSKNSEIVPPGQTKSLEHERGGNHHKSANAFGAADGQLGRQGHFDASFGSPAGDTSGVRSAEDEHPAVRPLSVDLEPRSPVQPVKRHDLATRDSSSSLYDNGSVSPGSQPLSAPATREAGLAEKQRSHAHHQVDDHIRLSGDSHGDANVDVDYTLDTRQPVTHETVHPHIHTVYQPRRTRSIHIEEHYYHIQPIIDTSSRPAEGQPGYVRAE